MKHPIARQAITYLYGVDLLSFLFILFVCGQNK